ncbi:MAG: hypothetical protein CMK09_02990 [Ponticaulis sp.]|nr:hypothetical protein [Ponticaulis sp.]|tara:strand:- start:17712 stop:19001 length:1290 start_codon:yes stop_codon:yes gene_type:complete
MLHLLRAKSEFVLAIGYGFWLFILAAWWLIAHQGTQGISPLFILAGLFSLPILLKTRPKFTPDALLFLVFLAWCVLSGIWSIQATADWVVIDFENDIYSIEATALRLVTAAGPIAFGYWALHHLSERAYGRAIWFARFGLGIQMLLMFGWIVYWKAFLDYGQAQTSSAGDLQQNLIRIVNLTVVMAPAFVALLPLKSLWQRALAYALLFAGLFVLARKPDIDTEAALLALAAISVTLVLAQIFGRKLFSWFAYATAALTVLMPAFLYGLLQVVDPKTAGVSLSAQSRLDGYAYLLNKIFEKPFLGWGVRASASWTETRMMNVPGVGEVEFPIVAGHPHNYAMELWAETGLVGVLLAAIAIILLGRRLSKTSNTRPEIVSASLSLWTGALVLMMVSYSVWNDAFWAGIAFTASIILAISKRNPAPVGKTA